MKRLLTFLLLLIGIYAMETLEGVSNTSNSESIEDVHKKFVVDAQNKFAEGGYTENYEYVKEKFDEFLQKYAWMLLQKPQKDLLTRIFSILNTYGPYGLLSFGKGTFSIYKLAAAEIKHLEMNSIYCDAFTYHILKYLNIYDLKDGYSEICQEVKQKIAEFSVKAKTQFFKVDLMSLEEIEDTSKIILHFEMYQAMQKAANLSANQKQSLLAIFFYFPAIKKLSKQNFQKACKFLDSLHIKRRLEEQNILIFLSLHGQALLLLSENRNFYLHCIARGTEKTFEPLFERLAKSKKLEQPVIDSLVEQLICSFNLDEPFEKLEKEVLNQIEAACLWIEENLPHNPQMLSYEAVTVFSTYPGLTCKYKAFLSEYLQTEKFNFESIDKAANRCIAKRPQSLNVNKLPSFFCKLFQTTHFKKLFKDCNTEEEFISGLILSVTRACDYIDADKSFYAIAEANFENTVYNQILGIFTQELLIYFADQLSFTEIMDIFIGVFIVLAKRELPKDTALVTTQELLISCRAYCCEASIQIKDQPEIQPKEAVQIAVETYYKILAKVDPLQVKETWQQILQQYYE